jgi:hypothetical protein
MIGLQITPFAQRQWLPSDRRAVDCIPIGSLSKPAHVIATTSAWQGQRHRGSTLAAAADSDGLTPTHKAWFTALLM